MNNGYIYLHIIKENGVVFYVGMGGFDKKEKLGSYKRAYAKRGRNKFWYNIIQKYEYDVEIIYKNLTNEQCQEKEKELISFYGRRDLNKGTLTNLTDGGEDGKNVNVGKIPFNKGKSNIELFGEEKAKELSELMSEIHKGNQYRKGKVASQETIDKLIKSHKNQKPINKGKSNTEMFGEEKAREISIKISQGLIGNIPWNKGVTYNDELKIKMSENCSTKKSVIIDGVNYNSIKEASIKLGILRCTIRRKCLSDKFKNYTFRT